MALWDRITHFLALEPWQDGAIQTRADDSSIADLMARFNVRDSPWRPAGIKEALGVPAIFGAVNLVANLVGSMSMVALRNGVELAPEDRPRVIVRPDPFTIPREFYRSTTYNLASRGEAWWWIAKRDIDLQALSVLSIPPHEVMVEDGDNPLRPKITWRGKLMPNEDFQQLVYSREPGDLRGHGPLQMCGAAVSVAVESQEWAANFYAGGGNPSLILRSDVDMEQQEADDLRARWMAIPNNTPHIVTPGLNVDEFGKNEQGAQMLQGRQYQNVEVATMFGMPAPILNAAIAGASLSYQNVGTEFEKLLRQCLRPNYLEVIEQTMSDLLTRSTVARFHTDALTLADVKTRYEVYGIGIDKGIITPERAQQYEGLTAGDVENAPMPFSVPQAIPVILPVQERTGPEPIISREEVLAARERLRQSGQAHGYASLARHLNVSIATVRRRLAA